MRNRRLYVLASTIVVAAFLAYFAVIHQPLAQPGPGGGGGAMGTGPGPGGGASGPMGPGGGAAMGSGPGGGAAMGGPGGGAAMGSGGGGGMGTGPGGPGGAGASSAIDPFPDRSTQAPDPERMTYAEFLARENLPPAPLPSGYLMTTDGQVIKDTRAAWYQRQNIYSGKVTGSSKVALGNPGARLMRNVQVEVAVKQKEMRAMEQAYLASLNGFWFEVGMPQVGSANALAPDTVPVTVDVIMHVKSGFQKSYGQLVYNKLKPFDNPGTGRQQFTVTTYRKGFYGPQPLTLSSEAVGVWNGLWPQNQIRLRLQDRAGDLIAEGTTGAGFSATTQADIVNPPEITYTPRYRYLMPDEGKTMQGGKLNLDYARGWHYRYSFTLNLEQLGRINWADVTLIGAQGVEGSHSRVN
jgi:hypothetical protein